MKKYRTLAAVAISAALIALPLILVQPGQSIQSAVNAAVAGDVITVAPGNYPESVVVTKSNLTIKCEVPLQCTAKRFDLWGSNITLDGFKLVGGLSYGVDVRQSNNTVRNVDISGVVYDFGLPRGQGAAVGIVFFGTGHTFQNINIHDIDQYYVDDLGYTEPHQDCFISWNVPARGGAGSYITIENVICNMPQSGDSFVSKVFASSGGAHHWTIKNLVSYTPLPCLFYDEAHHISITNSTFIGVGSAQGCKFLKLNSNPAPHDNTITNSIFQGITTTKPFYDYVTGSNNCFYQVANHAPDPGDIFANPLLQSDWSIPANSPCAGKGATVWSFEAGKTLTPTLISTVTSVRTATPTRTATLPPTATKTAVPTVCETMVSTKYHVTVCTK